jgi:hypothetical protein
MQSANWEDETLTKLLIDFTMENGRVKILGYFAGDSGRGVWFL